MNAWTGSEKIVWPYKLFCLVNEECCMYTLESIRDCQAGLGAGAGLSPGTGEDRGLCWEA